MSWTRSAATAAILAGAGAAWAGAAQAGKPGGGGAPPPPPAVGRIYFQDGSDATPWPGLSYPYAATLVGMDGNGGTRQASVPTALSGSTSVSRLLHGGRRWILDMQPVEGGGPRALFALREDGALRVQLTSNPLMHYILCDWAPDESAASATVVLTGRRLTEPLAVTVVPGSCGLYTARVVFDEGGDVVGLEAEPTFASALPTRGNAGQELPDVRSGTTISWSPDMTRFAFERGQTWGRILVVDFATGSSTDIGAGEHPSWSPDGARIACVRRVPGKKTDAYALESLNPDGSGRITITSVSVAALGATSAWLDRPRWSPDGAYLAYRYSISFGPGYTTSWVYRVGANGLGATNLTPEVQPGGTSGFGGAQLVDWR